MEFYSGKSRPDFELAAGVRENAGVVSKGEKKNPRQIPLYSSLMFADNLSCVDVAARRLSL